MALSLATAWGCRAESEAGSEAWTPTSVGSTALGKLDGEGGNACCRGAAGSDRRARAHHRAAAGRSRFFSQSLASHRRAAAGQSGAWRRRIYALIQAMITQEMQ